MKKIPLTHGNFALVDDDDYDRLMATGKGRWHLGSDGYARQSKDYKKEGNKRSTKAIIMHRVILGLSFGDGLQVDHINRDKLDNRKSNLRVCTVAQNSANKGICKNNTSGFKGVIFDKSRGKFMAKIKFENKPITIGRFQTAIEAAKAYNEAAIKYFKEFAYLNNVEGL